jgi:hypothetical protein
VQRLAGGRGCRRWAEPALVRVLQVTQGFPYGERALLVFLGIYRHLAITWSVPGAASAPGIAWLAGLRAAAGAFAGCQQGNAPVSRACGRRLARSPAVSQETRPADLIRQALETAATGLASPTADSLGNHSCGRGLAS